MRYPKDILLHCFSMFSPLWMRHFFLGRKCTDCNHLTHLGKKYKGPLTTINSTIRNITKKRRIETHFEIRFKDFLCNFLTDSCSLLHFFFHYIPSFIVVIWHVFGPFFKKYNFPHFQSSMLFHLFGEEPIMFSDQVWEDNMTIKVSFMRVEQQSAKGKSDMVS